MTSAAKSSNASPGERTLTLNARPEPLSLTAGRTAVLVVDMQNDFGAVGGGMDLAGFDTSVIRRAVQPIARVIETARMQGIPVIYMKHGYRSDLSDMGPGYSKNWLTHVAVKVGERVATPDRRDGQVRVADTWNTEILVELAPKPGDIVLSKTRFSAFYGTELDATLTRLGVKDLIITGCTTSVCVESTVRDAMFRDYRAIVPADCTEELQGDDFHQASLLLIERMFGWVTDSSAVIDAFGSASA
ncbi:cysteine hydrolase family protein [Nocardia sp. NPDC004750]